MPSEPLTSERARDDVVCGLRDVSTAGSRRVIIGFIGPPGVGKSTFAESVVDEVNAHQPGSAAYLPMDGFHLANAQLDRLGRRDRKGAPDTFDVDGYAALLMRVARSYRLRDVYAPGFDRAVDEPVAAALVVPASARVVVTEGNYLALPTHGWAGVRPLIERLYYLDAEPAVRRRRLIQRHVSGGRNAQQAESWVDTVDERNAQLIAATRTACDQVLTIGAR